MRFEGNKLTGFLGTICHITHEEKLFPVQLYENKSREQSAFADNRALLPSGVIDFAMLPASKYLIWRIVVVGVLVGDIGWVQGTRVHHIYIANILYQ